jgi:sporulation protein YhbH
VAVTQPDYDSSSRGQTDAARHREKVREAIRRNLPDIISDEAIITRKKDQVLRVPVRGVKSYRFIHKHGEGSGGGFGTGESEKGKTIGVRPKPGKGQPGKAGEEAGVDYLETEIDIEELIGMLLEDLGLPNLRQKEVVETQIPKGWKIDSVEKHGIRPRLDKKRTIKEAIKRTETLVSQLILSCGRSEEECRAALDHARGDVLDALKLLRSNGFSAEEMEHPTVYLDSSDLRYRTVTQDVEHQSNAVVLAMMDVSGSMSTMKKYLARSFYFWMLSFLKTRYKHVEIRFIAHTTVAKLVDEHQFFHHGESGGTFCYSAYDMAGELIDSEYPTSRWNVYPFHFSDGEDWNVEHTLESLKAVLRRGVSSFGYGEIPGDYSSSVLMDAYRKGLHLKKADFDGLVYFEGEAEQSPVLGVVIKTRQDLYPALRVFLRPEVGREAAWR